MKRNYTYRTWSVFLFLLLCNIIETNAQTPKYLSKYPVAAGNGQAVNAIAQKGNVVYIAGNFTDFGKKPPINGILYDNFNSPQPNPNFAAPKDGNDQQYRTIADGAGGFFIFGNFTEVGDAPRANMARINSDGNLNPWNPQSGLSFFDQVTSGLLQGNKILISGSFTAFGGSNTPAHLVLLDTNNGNVLPGWDNLNLNNNDDIPLNLLYNDTNHYLYVIGASTITVINITNLNSPVVVSTFNLDAQTNDQTVPGINLKAVKQDGSILLMSVSHPGDFDSYGYSYQLKKQTGDAFDGHLFSVDGTTGNISKVYSTGLSSHDVVEDIAVQGNEIYITYTDAEQTVRKLKAFRKDTGEDISSSLPAIDIQPFGGSMAKLYLTSDHRLILYGKVTKVNDEFRSMVVIDPVTKVLSDWNPIVHDNSYGVSSPASIAESAGKIYALGPISGGLDNGFKGLAAFNANSGEMLNWKPSELSGTFKALTISNNTLIVGGNFSLSDGSGAINNLASYDISDINNPKFISSWKPNPDMSVNALLLKDDKLYVGGDFTNINSKDQSYIAEFDVAGNTPKFNSSWNPKPDNSVFAFATLDNMLYVGGAFKNIGSEAREGVAAFNLISNNSLTSWDPKLSDPYAEFGNPHDVFTLAVQSAEGSNHASRVFIGGDYFTTAGTDAQNIRQGLAVVNTTDGKLDPWQLDQFAIGGGFSIVHALAVNENKLYLGGDYFFNSADISSNFAQLDDIHYLDDPNSGLNIQKAVTDIFPSSNLLFVIGDFQSGLNDPTLNGLSVFQTGDIQPVITFADITKTYGDAAFAPAATSTVDTNPITYRIADGDNADNVISLADGKITILKPGTAKITASQAGATEIKATITIAKAQLSIHPNNATTVVNQSFPDFPFTLTGWKNKDETKTGIVSGRPEFSTDASETSPVGTYALTVSGAGTLASDYYTFIPAADETATLTINATGDTPQTITFPALAAKTYGDADFDPAAATDATGLAVTYTSSDESIATIMDGKIHIAGAGTVTLTASQAGDATYSPAEPVSQTLTVAKAALTITADDKTINREDALPDFTATYTGLVNGDEATDLATAPTFTTTATQASGPGTYPISVADAASGNYEIAYTNGTLTIKGTQVITWAPLSTLTYGDAPFDPGAASDAGATFTPVYTTDNPQVIAIANGQAVIKGAGTATITATFAAAGGFERTTGTLKVTVLKKPLTITADDQTRGFGEADPVFTLSYNGFVNGDTYSTPGTLTSQPSAGTTVTSTSPVGNYPITVSGATSDNYQISVVPGTLHITALARTLTYNAIPAKTYGNPDFDIASLSSGETPAYTFSDPSVATVLDGRIHILGAGSTDITVSAPANANYNAVEPVTQTLTVGKAPLIITADNKTKTQGPPDIVLTASYRGFVNGDNSLSLPARPTLTTTANANSPIGQYPITVSGASSPNYDITYQNGTLTIMLAAGQDELIVDQALSPNGDGINDYFQIGGIENFPTNHVIILNRNGSKVYEVDGYDNANKKFEGRSNQGGSYLQQGTYYYLISYKVDGQEKKAKGYLILKY